MNSKKTRFYRIFPTLFLGGILVFSGCEKSNDLYNPDHLQEEAKKAFPVKDIDPNQTWETSAICNASVTVNEKSGGTYTIKVYTENPYNTNGNAYLLAKTSVADGQTANFKFDIPTTLQYVYVMKVNEEGYSSAVPVAVENGSAKVTFGTETTRAMSNKSITAHANTIKRPASLPTEAPAGSILLSSLSDQWNNVKKDGNYIVDSNIKSINVGQPINLYIKGNVTLTKLYIQIPWGSTATAHIYILPQSSLTVIANESKTIKDVFGNNEDMSFFSIATGLQIGVGKDAELVCEKAIIFNQETNLYNCGTIKATHLEFNNNSQFVNDGKVAISSLFSCENTTTQVENNGEITAGSFHLAGTSSFFNESTGKVTITGESAIDSNSSTWDNQGRFESKTMTFKASSPNWLNRCKLYVNEKLTIIPGNSNDGLIMDAGSYAECGSLYMDQGRVIMRSESFFNVLGEAKFLHNPNGFIAENEKYALLKMGSAVQEDKKQGFSISYQGKLYIACDHHFAQGNDGQDDHPLYDINNGAQMTGTDNANIKIPASTCNPGYNSTPDGGGEKDKVIEYAYAFEDMMVKAGDYDFNDVVLFVTTPYKKDGKLVIDATLKAAGATKKLKVLFKNGTTTTTLFENAHTALGVSEGTIVNTGATTGTPSTVTIEVGENFNLTNNGDFYISDGQREIHIPNFTTGFKAGDAPYALRIAQANWKWPKEQIQITEAYPDFANWANDATQAPDWYNNFNSGKVMGIE